MRLYVLLLGAANQPLCEPVMVSTGVEGFAVVSARRVYKEIKGDCPPSPCRYLIATLVLNGGDMDKFPSCFALALDLLKLDPGQVDEAAASLVRIASKFKHNPPTSLGVIVGKSGIAYRRGEDGGLSYVS